jgi:hypothetical protein
MDFRPNLLEISNLRLDTFVRINAPKTVQTWSVFVLQATFKRPRFRAVVPFLRMCKEESMKSWKTFQFVARVVVTSLLLPAGPLFAQDQPGSTPPAPIPAELLSARKIFVSNAGADSGLFPHPFSGDPNRGYNELFVDLHALIQFELVSSPAQADLVLELRLVAPYGPTSPNKQNGAADPLPMFRLVVYDRPSHYVLWTFTNTVEVALKQQTHDRNFDEAVSNLVAGFQAITRAPRAGDQ